MAKKYVMVRVPKQAFERMINEKKIPIEQEVKALTGKDFELKNTDLMKLASKAVWDFGDNYEQKIIGTLKVKKKDLKDLRF